jgi:hypothetical protein
VPRHSQFVEEWYLKQGHDPLFHIHSSSLFPFIHSFAAP